MPSTSSYRGASLSPVIRAADTGAKVTFRITLLQPGDTKNPTVTFLKTAAVQSDGSATTSFTGLPEGSAIGEITIDGGNIGGKSLFHGASDLFPGDNTITVSPKGSLHQSDILANAMLAIAADPELIKIAKPNLVTNAANAAATLLANPDENVYTKVLDSITNNSLTFDSTKYTQITISTPDATVSGQRSGPELMAEDLRTVLAGNPAFRSWYAAGECFAAGHRRLCACFMAKPDKKQRRLQQIFHHGRNSSKLPS